VLLLVAGPTADSIDLVLYTTADEGHTLQPGAAFTGPALDLLPVDASHWLVATGQPLVSVTGSGATVAQPGDLNIYCLLGDRGATLGCTAHLRVGYAIARSVDDGVSFTPWMTYDQLQPPADRDGAADSMRGGGGCHIAASAGAPADGPAAALPLALLAAGWILRRSRRRA
jgi:MYXO-CTERM domain-containing protein